MMSRRAPILAVSFAFALATGCAKPKPLSITPKSAQIQSLSARGIELAVTFDVMNPNRFPLIVHAVDGHFSVGPGAGIELGTAHAEPSASIAAQTTSTVSSTVAVAWTNLAALAPFALAPGAVPYTFTGSASIGGSELNVALPFTLTGELTRAQLLSTLKAAD